ncbi:recombinase family protein, partial [Streptomyces koyangensis]
MSKIDKRRRSRIGTGSCQTNLAPVPAVRTRSPARMPIAKNSGRRSYLREGDTLVVPLLDRLGRSIQDLIAIASGLRKRGVGFTSLREALDTTMPGGRLVFHVFAAPAEFIRELIVQGTTEGLDAARARVARLVRPLAMTEEQVRHARDLLARPENTVASIAKLLGVSRNTIYNYVPELKGGRLALAEVIRARRNCPNPAGPRTDHRRLWLVTAFLPAPQAGRLRRPAAASAARQHRLRRRLRHLPAAHGHLGRVGGGQPGGGARRPGPGRRRRDTVR